MNKSDEQLIFEYLNGDKKSLEILIQYYLKQIYGFVFRYVKNKADAEDITQEVFLRVWRNIKKFKTDKNFKPWIFSIAKNASLDFIKKKKPLSFAEFNKENGENILIEALADFNMTPYELSEYAGDSLIISDILKKIPYKFRTIINFKHRDGHTFAEIALILGKSINTVKSNYRRSIITLKKLLNDNS